MNTSLQVTIGGQVFQSVIHIADTTEREPVSLYISLIDKSKTNLKAALTQWSRGQFYELGYGNHFNQEKSRAFKTGVKNVYSNYQSFFYGEAISPLMDAESKQCKYFLATSEDEEKELYKYLMKHFNYPLKEEWAKTLFDALFYEGRVNKLISTRYGRNSRNGVLCQEGAKFFYNGNFVDASRLHLYKACNLTKEYLGETITRLIKERKISVSDVYSPALDIKDLDEYIIKYRASLFENVTSSVDELVHIKTDEIYADNVAFKTKRLFETQCEKVMGVTKSLEKGAKYALLNLGMGCGKTLISLAIVEEFYNSKFLKKNKGKTLKDAFDEGAVKYRNIVICPSHLTAKWQEEILKEVPGAKVVMLNSLEQLIELKGKGKERTGKEFYLIGKDFCKLGLSYKPVPTKIKKRVPSIPVCKRCYNSVNRYGYVTHNMVTKTNSGDNCRICGGKEWISMPIAWEKPMKALACPDCGELLIKPASDYRIDIEPDKMAERLIRPVDFAAMSTANDRCFNCGSALWTTVAKNLQTKESSAKEPKESKWYKIKHWKNKAKKDTENFFVLKDHEMEYCLEKKLQYGFDLQGGGYDKAEVKLGRKYAPSAYIKKYLKGYFDFCILDEVHKFEGEDTAQARAAQALVGASYKALGLTGTIANGKITSLWSLFWLLDPGRMKSMGYNKSSDSAMDFARVYGTVEEVFEGNSGADIYNKNSRGRKIQPPKVKPGISPRVLLDFLIDRAVFMDITDIDESLPELKEEVVLVDMDDDVANAYKTSIKTLQGVLRSREGASARTNILQIGLSYPDKPYGREPVMSTVTEGNVILNPPDLKYYESIDNLLNKERKIVDIINKEIGEGRNCFLYVNFTGDNDANIMGRLVKIIEKNCNLTDRVCAIQSSSPKAADREAYIRRKAAEGIKVFIINPKCVETGLDFCFEYEGRAYNIPTIIFVQPSYELAVLWQASRRHYRANQTQECRTYWMAYKETLQATALEIMAHKQVAVSAIQGKFSSEGLASMASGVDAQQKLAEALLAGDMSDSSKIEGLFTKVNKANQYGGEEGDFVFRKPMLYREVVGLTETTEVLDTEDLFGILEQNVVTGNKTVPEIKVDEVKVDKETKVAKTGASESTEEFANLLFGELFMEFTVGAAVGAENDSVGTKPKKKKKKDLLDSCTYRLF